jgi:hypothetical protein
MQLNVCKLLAGDKAMTFVTEWLDEAAREKAGVPVTNWVVDVGRDIQMWIPGKHWQLRAEGDYSETVVLRIHGKEIIFEMMPAGNFRTYVKGRPHEYVWERVISCSPHEMHGLPRQEVMAILKEALTAEGGGGHSNQRHPDFSVSFQF